MAEKLTGVEMMMQSMLRAAGINPKELIESVENTAKNIASNIAQLNANMTEINTRLQRLEKHLLGDVETSTVNGVTHQISHMEN